MVRDVINCSRFFQNWRSPGLDKCVFRCRQSSVRRVLLLPNPVRCLNCAQRFDYRALGSSRELGGEPASIWLTVAKNTFVGLALNFRVRMLLKGAVIYSHKDFVICIVSLAIFHPHFSIRILSSAFFNPHFIIRIFLLALQRPELLCYVMLCNRKSGAGNQTFAVHVAEAIWQRAYYSGIAVNRRRPKGPGKRSVSNCRESRGYNVESRG